MKRLVLGSLVVVSGLLVISLYVLLLRTEGLHLCLKAADRFLPGQLSAESVQGRLISQFSLQGVRYVEGTNDFFLDDVSISWRPVSLLHKELEITSLSMDGVRIVSEATGEETDVSASDKDILLPPVTLPLTITVRKAVINSLAVKNAGDAPETRLNSMAIEELSGHEQLLQFGNFKISSDTFGITAQGQLQTGDVYVTQMDISYLFKSEDLPPVTGIGFLEGSLDELRYESHLQTPFSATLKGVANDLTGRTGWQGAFTADRVRMSELNESWPDVVLTGAEFSGEGDLETYSLRVQTNASYDSFEDILFTATIEGDANGLRARDIRLGIKDSVIAGHGNVSWAGTLSWLAAFTADKVNVSELNKNWPDVVLTGTEFSGKGNHETYSLQVQTNASYDSFEDMLFSAATEGDLNGLKVKNVRLVEKGSVVTGQGHVSWADALSWQVNISGSQFDPSFIDERWPGQLHFEAFSSGQQKNGEIHAVVDLQNLDGQLREIPLTAGGKVQVAGEDLVINEFFLHSADSILQVSGYLAENFDLGFTLNSPDLYAMWPEFSGAIDAAGRISGTREKPHFQFDLAGNEIAVGDTHITNIVTSGSGSLIPDGEIQASFLATGLFVGESPIDSVTADLHGSVQNHVLEARFDAPNVNSIVKLEGAYDNKVWKGYVNTGEIRTDQFSDWQLQNVVPLFLSADKVDIGRFCLAESGSAFICVDGKFEKNGTWDAKAEISSLPVSLFESMQDRFREIKGMINGTATLQGSGQDMGEIRMDLSADDLSLHLDINEELSRYVAWRKNAIRLVYQENTVEIQINSTLKDNSTIVTEAILSDIGIFPFSIEKTGVQGKVQFDMRDLQFLSALSYPIVEPYGSLGGAMDISGTLERPEFQGNVQLKQGKMFVPSLGITVRDVQAKVDGKDDTFRLTITASSDDGSIQADGVYSFSGKGENPFDFHLLGDNFEMSNLPVAKIRISPDLSMKIHRGKANLQGNVFINEAYISLNNLNGNIKSSKDIVLIDDQTQQKKADLPLDADVTITTGDKVYVNAFGLKGRLEGKLQVKDSPGKATTGRGALNVREGTFSIYGRQLKIVKGRLLYSGNPLDNPGIEVRAENTAGGVTTGIAVSGFLQEPDINFYSSPAMEQDEIIKRLLMNTTLVGSSEDEGFVGSVAADTGLDPIASAVQDVKESLRVDDIKIETGKESDDLSLVVGTWLSPKLYISYGKNLLKESGSFNTRYLLGRGFFLETESGPTQNGFDLKYEIDR